MRFLAVPFHLGLKKTPLHKLSNCFLGAGAGGLEVSSSCGRSFTLPGAVAGAEVRQRPSATLLCAQGTRASGGVLAARGHGVAPVVRASEEPSVVWPRFWFWVCYSEERTACLRRVADVLARGRPDGVRVAGLSDPSSVPFSLRFAAGPGPSFQVA